MSTKNAPLPATPESADPPKPATQGGSFVIGKDGKPVRQEYTRQPGDPDHEANMKAPADSEKEA